MFNQKVTIRDMILFSLGVFITLLIDHSNFQESRRNWLMKSKRAEQIDEWIKENQKVLLPLEKELDVKLLNSNPNDFAISISVDRHEKLDEVIVKVTKWSMKVNCPYRIVYH